VREDCRTNYKNFLFHFVEDMLKASPAENFTPKVMVLASYGCKESGLLITEYKNFRPHQKLVAENFKKGCEK